MLRASTEILLNFVGVGAFCIYLSDEERQVFFPVMREGGPVEAYNEEPIADVIASAPALQNGESWKPGDAAEPWAKGELMALPLYAGSRLVGVARLQSFLEQKADFTAGDHELVALVSEHAGIGVENAWVRAHADNAPLARQAVEHLVRA